jgi:hypothetical protein
MFDQYFGGVLGQNQFWKIFLGSEQYPTISQIFTVFFTKRAISDHFANFSQSSAVCFSPEKWQKKAKSCWFLHQHPSHSFQSFKTFHDILLPNSWCL